MFTLGKSTISRLGARFRYKSGTACGGRCLTSNAATSTAFYSDTQVKDKATSQFSTLQAPKTNGYSGVQYSVAHKTLPEETLYIFDGTAMLFLSYFASGGVSNGMKNGSNLKPATNNEDPDSMQFFSQGGALLSPELNRRIIASMNDDQVRIMINCLAELDPTAASSTITSTDAASTSDTTSTSSSTTVASPTAPAPVTAEDREKLQLRCEPLVVMLMQFARFVRDVKPKYVAVAFDAGRTTFRTKLYPQYKEHRTPVRALIY